MTSTARPVPARRSPQGPPLEQARPGPAPRGLVALTAHQLRYDLRALRRNRQAQFFTLALPVLFLVIFASIFGGHGHTVPVPGGRIDTSVSYVPGIMTLGIVAAAFINLVVSVVAQRETGVLKRRRATPVPAAALIAGRALTAVVVATTTAAALLAIGWAAFGAHVPARTAPALVLTVVVGTVSFCCLAYAVASTIQDQDAAQPVTQGVMLPLYFISGVFVPTSTLPHWLVAIANLFPVRHLAAALLTAYNPHTRGPGFAATDLAVVVAWGAAGLGVALRRFGWQPTDR
jgi:ABC-2 type transport system permease protein